MLFLVWAAEGKTGLLLGAFIIGYNRIYSFLGKIILAKKTAIPYDKQSVGQNVMTIVKWDPFSFTSL